MRGDLTYWKKFYSGSKAPTFPSQFAIFVQSWLQDQTCEFIELGCGNGRDSTFLLNFNHKFHICDQVIGSHLTELADNVDNLNYYEGDIENALSSALSELDNDSSKRVAIYSRFFQHSISHDKQKAILKMLGEQLPANSILFFEFRISEDAQEEKTFDNHFRRFQSVDEFLDDLDHAGFKASYVVKGKGYSVFGSNEDPFLGRFIVQRKISSK